MKFYRSVHARQSHQVKKGIARFKARCFSCNGYLYSIRNVRTCDYCMKQVHLKCFNNDLGCTKCCESMIPGFHAYSYELIGDTYYNNNKMFNPYDGNHFTQLIGEVLGGEEEMNQIFQDVSELLVNCKYKQIGKMDIPSNTELSILSLNVCTLRNKIDIIREIYHFMIILTSYFSMRQTAYSKNCPMGNLIPG